MMISNEQRAHDLAVAAASILAAHDLSESKPVQDSPNRIEFYENYAKGYATFLAALNSDFPEGS